MRSWRPKVVGALFVGLLPRNWVCPTCLLIMITVAAIRDAVVVVSACGGYSVILATVDLVPSRTRLNS